MRSYLAWILVAVAAVGLVVVVACGDSGKSCKPGTLALTIELRGTAALADTLTISFRDPSQSMTVAHDPNGPTLLVVDVDFPGGYPADKLVVLSVTASGGITRLGENSANIHLLPGCSSGFVSVAGGNLYDAGAVD
jgi:hypothetical protein